MRLWRQLWAGARTVPTVPWRAASAWRPTRLGGGLLVLGLAVFGVGEALVLQSRIGNSPWTVLAEGLSSTTGVDIGIATFIISSLVLLAWWPLRQRPGLGTIANVIVIAVALDAATRVIPAATSTAVGVGYAIGGTLLVGLGSGIYLTTGLGPGPRDGLMTALHHRSGRTVAHVRFAIEVTVLAAGWLLGGTVGAGTVVFALLVPRAVAWGLALLSTVGRLRRS